MWNIGHKMFYLKGARSTADIALIYGPICNELFALS